MSLTIKTIMLINDSINKDEEVFTDIIKRTKIERANMNRIIKRYEKHGLIKLLKNNKDKRKLVIKPTNNFWEFKELINQLKIYGDLIK